MSGESLCDGQSLFVSGLFKRFNQKESVSNTIQMKLSDLKKLRSRLSEDYPALIPYLDDLMPKKETHLIVKCSSSVELIASPAGEVLFFKQRKSPYIPCLRLLHRFPFLLPQQSVDKGAIKFVLSGANIMCPGLTSCGGRLNTDCDRINSVVAIHAEGMEHALAIGFMRMTPSDIQRINKGIAIDVVHYVDDGLWNMPNVK